MKRKIFSKLLMGAFLIASVSMFVSCKDYDDDISKNAADIAALQSQLSSLKSDLTSQLNAAQSELANKASSADVTALAAKVTALETQIKAIDDCASKSDLATLQATVAALTGELDKKATQDDIAKAVEAQNKIQADALDAFKKEVEAKGYLTGDALTQLTADVADLKDKLSKIDVNAAIEELQKKSQETLDELTKKINEEIATMKLFVTGKLTSVVLKPDFYWEGIEGVEVPQLNTPIFTPIGKYTFSYGVTNTDGTVKGNQLVEVVVDEVMAAHINGAADYDYIVLETSDGKESVKDNKRIYKWQYWNVLQNETSADGNPEKNYSIKVKEIEGAIKDFARSNKNIAPSLDYAYIQENPIINYHINPSTADIEGAKIAFYENDAEVYTRNGTDAISPAAVVDTYTKAGENADDPHHTNIYDKATGILSIPFQCNWTVVNNMFDVWANKNFTSAVVDGKKVTEPTWDTDLSDDDNAYGSVGVYDSKTKEWLEYNNAAPLPLIAVELTTKDTLVTSDYAVVVPAKLQIIALADNAPEEKINGRSTEFTKNHNKKIKANHLYESVGYTYKGGNEETATTASEWDVKTYGAIPMSATHSVAYNGTIDLNDFVETHCSYTTYTKYGQSNDDRLMTAEEMKALGLHYEFKAINYIKGKNVTGESVHIEEIAEGVFAPRSVNADGTQISGQTATREAIGREPLIRVDLVDAAGEIVRYGYIKLRIVDVVENYEPVEVVFGDQYMNCGTSVAMTWSQVENLILAKLNDGKGMTKQEFEKAFYFDNQHGYEVMPANRALTVAADGVDAESGKLYTDAAKNEWWGKRFYKKADGTFAAAMGKDTESKAYGYNEKDGKEDPDNLANNEGSYFNAENNWFGRVWYTPHDNSTDPQAWDEQTNVLIWNILPEVEGNMNKARYQNLMKKVGVDENNPDYKFDGASTVDLKTTVRFVNKASGKNLYVTLVIPATKLHFNYGEVGNKDWSHWFKFNGSLWGGAYHNGIEGASSTDYPYWEEFDTHVNPHKPSNVNYVYLDPTSLTQKLTDFWLDPTNMVIMKGGDAFTMFKTGAKGKATEGTATTVINQANPAITFIFTYPKDNQNSEGTTASKIKLTKDGVWSTADKEYNDAWQVKGASGTIWTLVVGAHGTTYAAGNTAIWAVGKCTDGKTHKTYGPEEVAYLDGTGTNATNTVIHYHGLEAAGVDNLYPAATDLINKSGAYDAQGNERFTRGGGLAGITTAEYLEKNIDETFTAYIKINVAHGCYDPIVAKQYFNVRIYRPINVAGLEVEWYDRVLADNTLAITDLIEVVDCNDFAVVAWNSAAVKERNTVFGIERPKYADVFNNATSMKATNLGIPFEYYGISQLAVRYDEIRTDHAKEVSVRNSVYYDEENIIKNTDAVKGLPSLSSDREAPTGYKTLTLLNADNSIVSFTTDHAWSHSQKNADGSTKFGSIYYNNDAGTVQLFHIYVPIAVKYNWGNIAWDDILNDQPGKKLDNDYTQKVWAVITVNATHKK